MLKISFMSAVLLCTHLVLAQTASVSLVTNQPDGRFTLSEAGASYFAQLSLDMNIRDRKGNINRANTTIDRGLNI